MRLGELPIVTGFLILEILIIVLCVKSFFKKADGRYGSLISVIFLVQVLCVLAFFIGSQSEDRKEFLNQLYDVFPDEYEQRNQSLEIEGDPRLLKFAEGQSPEVARPNLHSIQEFQNWQQSRRKRLQDLFSWDTVSMPPLIQVRNHSSELIDSKITRNFITLKAFDETSIPGYLMVPNTHGPKPAIIVLPGHVADGEEGIKQTAGFDESYQHNAALELSKVGYVTLTIELRGFGKLGREVGTEHRLVAYNAILGGSFYKAIISQDIRYAIQYLSKLNDVDPSRLGITGVSYGGEMALTYAALDERVKVVVFHGFGGSVGPMRGVVGSQINQPHYCHVIPGFNKLFFKEDLALLIAPRPMLGLRGKKENLLSVADFKQVIGKAYETSQAQMAFQFEEVEGFHEFFTAPALEFFNKYL